VAAAPSPALRNAWLHAGGQKATQSSSNELDHFTALMLRLQLFGQFYIMFDLHNLFSFEQGSSYSSHENFAEL